MNIKTTVCSILAVLFMISCDEDTSGLGGSLTPAGDIITVLSDSCFATSTTIKATDSLVVLTSNYYLGRFTEQENGTSVQAGFLTQVGCMENFSLADSVYGIGDYNFPQWFIDKVGEQKPYYANLKLYYSSYFGDSTNTFQIDVYALDKMIDGNTKYYADVNPQLFCDVNSGPIASVMASAYNMQDPDESRDNENYYPSITIPLPDTLAEKILSAYYNPATKHYFTDSQAFMENLVKGFYVCCSQGDGTMLYIDRVILEVNFKCISYEDDEPKMESLLAEFAGNSEVIQLNSFKWNGLETQIADNSCTWIRTPFGVLTEITLPIDDMRSDEYILNAAQLRLSTAITPSNRFKPSVPSTLMLIRKDLLQEFFAKNSMTDNIESYATPYSTKYGTYTFENIAAMVEKIYSDREEWLTAHNMTSTDDTSIKAYESAVPNWNKAVLIPVTANSGSANAVISYSLDLKMRQVKLVGGPNNKLKIKTIRSKF